MFPLNVDSRVTAMANERTYDEKYTWGIKMVDFRVMEREIRVEEEEINVCKSRERGTKMKEEKQALTILILCTLTIILYFMCGCSSVKYSYVRGDVEIEARYFRFLNQEVEGLSLNTELFQAKLDEQSSNNDEAVGGISSSIGKGLGQVVVP